MTNEPFRGAFWWATAFPSEDLLKKVYMSNLEVDGRYMKAKFSAMWNGGLGKQALDAVRFKRHEFIKLFRDKMLSEVENSTERRVYRERVRAYEQAVAAGEDPEELERPRIPKADEIAAEIQARKAELAGCEKAQGNFAINQP